MNKIINIDFIVYIGGYPKYFKTKEERDNFYNSYNGILKKHEDRDRSNYEECIWKRTILHYTYPVTFLFWKYEFKNSKIIE